MFILLMLFACIVSFLVCCVLMGPTGIAAFVLIVMFWHWAIPNKKE